MVTEDTHVDTTLTPDENLQPDWENTPSLADLKLDFVGAKIDHDRQVIKIKTWLSFLNITGEAKVTPIKGRSSVQPKLIRKQAEWRYAALSEPFLSTEDVFNVDPVAHGDAVGAIQNSIILNNQFNTKLDKVRLVDDAVRTSVDEGTLIFRTGWEFEEEEVITQEPVISYTPTNDPAVMQEQAQIHNLMETRPDDYAQLPPEVRGAHEQFMKTGVPVVGEVTGTTSSTKMKTILNQPTVEVCDYQDITIDPTCKGDPSKIQFVVYSFETSKAELLKSGIDYHNLDLIQMESASPLAQADVDVSITSDTSFAFKDEPRKRMVAHEYWGFYDIHGIGTTVPIVATWIGNTLIRMEENPFPDQQLPFVFVSYLPVRKSIYGEPDGELLIDNQKIVGAVTRGMVDLMGRSANGQIGFRQDALDVTNKRKYEAGADYVFNPTIDPRQAIIEHTYPDIPSSAPYMVDSNNAEAESLTGVRAFNSNSNRGLGDTATEARGALDAASKRELGILRRIAGGFKQVGRKIISMNAEFLSEEEVVRITNEQFVTIRRDDLAGEYDLKLSISTAEADNEKAKELAFMLQTMGNNMDVEMSKLVLSDIARLRNMPELAKKFQEFAPAPNPMAEVELEKAKLENELLRAEIENEKNKGLENAEDVGLKSAKKATEEAKARNLNAGSDKQDLDFLEQEAGIPHQQDLEKQEHTRQSNLDLKAVDAMLAPESTATTA